MADYVATARFPFRPLSYEYKQQAVAKELIIDYAAGKGDLYVCDVTGTLLKVSDIIVSRSLDNVKDNIKVTIDGTSYKIEAGLAKIADKIKNNETRLASVDKIFTIPVNSSGVPTGAKPTSFAEEVIPSSAIKFDPNATDPYLPAKMVTGTLSNATIAAAKVTGLATVATSGSYNDLSNKPSIPVAGNTTTAVAAADSNTQGTATTWARSDHNHHLPTSGVTAGSKGPTAAVDGVEGATINVPKITVDKYGRVTALDHYQYTSRNTTYGYASTSTAGLVKIGDTLAISSGVLNQKSGVITAGTIGPDQTAATTLAFSGKFKVPKITYDAYGRVTGTSTIEFTLPANPDTDVKVTQTVKSDDADRPFILVPTATQNATTTTTSVFATGATLNAKTKKISLTYAGETGLTINNTNKEHQVDFIVGSSGKGGVYDRTNAKWVVYSDVDGTIGLGTGTNDSVIVGGNVTLGGSTNTVTVPGTLQADGSGLTNISVSSIPTMTGATASAAGKAGLVPAPAAGKNTSFLRGDGTWATINNTTDEKVKANLITATTTSYYLLGKSGTTTSTGEAYFNTTTYVNDNTLYSKSLNINNGKITISDDGQIMGNGFTLNLLGSGISNINSITSSSIKTDLINTNSANGLVLENVKKINNIEMPSNPKFTDINVTQTVKSDNKSYPLLLAPSGQTTTATTTANFSIKASVNASTGVITVGGLDAGTGAISGASLTVTGAIKGHSISTAYTNNSNETVYGAITAGNVTVKGKLSVDATSGSISGLLKYFTASIPIGTDSSWTGSGPYTCTIDSITGLLATDHAVLDLVASTTYATAKSQEEAYSQIYKAQVSAANTLKVWAHAKPSVAIPINLAVVR